MDMSWSKLRLVLCTGQQSRYRQWRGQPEQLTLANMPDIRLRSFLKAGSEPGSNIEINADCGARDMSDELLASHFIKEYDRTIVCA